MIGHLYIYGEIACNYSGKRIDGIVTPIDLQNQILSCANSTEIQLHINSYGGDVDAGFQMYDMILATGLPVTSINEGECLSIATVPFLAGVKRECYEHSLFMIHNPWSVSSGDASFHKEKAIILEEKEVQIAKFYFEKTGLDVDALKAEMNKDDFMTSAYAKSLGFVTEIKSPNKAAAKFLTKKEEMKNENTSLLDELKKLFKERSANKNLVLKTATDKELDFPNIVEGLPSIGEEVTLDGLPANGEFLMPSGETYVVEKGKLTEIKPKEEMLDVSAVLIEEMKALRVDAESIKAMRLEISSLKESIKNLDEMNSAIKSLVSGGANKESQSQKQDDNKKRKSFFSEIVK